jgi:cytochrome oxidase Cu insertion factor (SCO1/SenC/PrrC family)
MKILSFPILICATLLLSPLNLVSQQKKEFESSRNEGFLKRNPLVNMVAPDVEVFDEQGNPFQLAQSRGKHTVVVFGCLT